MRLAPQDSLVSTSSGWRLLLYAGTKDFLPEDMRLRNWLFGHFDAVSRLFGFEMVEGPVLESEELFTRKAGEEIVGQLYNFEVNDRIKRIHQLIAPLGYFSHHYTLKHLKTCRTYVMLGLKCSMACKPANRVSDHDPLSAWQWVETGSGMSLQDKGGRRVALRPELTPTLARLVLQKGKQLPLPAKWYQVPALAHHRGEHLNPSWLNVLLPHTYL